MAEVLEARPLPEDLDIAVPGPELARFLASVDRSKLDGPDVVALLKARNRQLAYEQGELLADLVEVAHCQEVGTVRSEQPLEFVEFEVACALTWTICSGRPAGLSPASRTTPALPPRPYPSTRASARCTWLRCRTGNCWWWSSWETAA